MPNEVNILIRSQDRSGEGFRSTNRSLGQVRQSSTQAGQALERLGQQSQETANRLMRAQQDSRDAIERASLAARQAQLALADASEKAERSQERAAEAARALARGEISEAEAARLAAAAQRDLERADIARTKAVRAQNDVIRKQSDHLDLMRTDLSQLGQAGGKAFDTIGDSAKKSGMAMRSSGGGGIAVVAAGIAALPWLASLAGSGITLGVGGALIGVGVLGASQSDRVKKAFTDLRKHVVVEGKEMSRPFEDTLVKSAGHLEDAFDDIAPTLREELADLAPVATEFSHSFASSLTEFKPAIRDVSDALEPLLGELGDRMPALMGRTADAISRIARSADPEMFGRFIDGLGKLITVGGHAIEIGTKLADTFYRFGPIAIVARNVDDFNRGLHNLTDGWFGASKGASEFERNLNSTQVGAGLAASSTAFLGDQTATTSGTFTKWAGTMKLASQTADKLKASLDKLAGKTLNLREASSAYEAAIDSATASIRENGKAHGFATEKGRANEAALDAIAVAAHNEAVAMRDSDKSAADVARRMEQARQKFIQTAIGMDYTRAQAVALANKMFGVRDAANAIPKARQTKFTTPGVGNAIRASKEMRAAVMNVPTTWDTYFRTHRIGDAIRASKAMAHGGIVGGLGGVGHAAEGGPRSNMTLVGEQGPELVRLPYGSTVIPNGQTESMMAAGGSCGPTHVTVEWVGGDPDFMSWLSNKIRITAGTGPNSVQQALGGG